MVHVHIISSNLIQPVNLSNAVTEKRHYPVFLCSILSGDYSNHVEYFYISLCLLCYIPNICTTRISMNASNCSLKALLSEQLLKFGQWCGMYKANICIQQNIFIICYYRSFFFSLLFKGTHLNSYKKRAGSTEGQQRHASV